MPRGPGAPRNTRTVVGSRSARAAAPSAASRGRAAASDGGIAAPSSRSSYSPASRVVILLANNIGQLNLDSTPRESTAGHGVAASAVDSTLAPPGADLPRNRRRLRRSRRGVLRRAAEREPPEETHRHPPSAQRFKVQSLEVTGDDVAGSISYSRLVPPVGGPH
jgi:hypothetical protein